MKGSSSAPPSNRAAYLIAAGYLAAHLPFLPPTLEDVDSVNFALGLRDFDPALHQPHPPGYPLYIALGRVSLFVISAIAPGLGAVRSEAMALAFWSALGGAVAIIAAAHLFSAVSGQGKDRHAAAWAAALMAAAPLFWMGGLRPLSDVAGLAAALTVQAMAMKGFADRRWLVAAAFAAGVAGGLRTQSFALTGPLLLLAIIAQRRAGIGWLLPRAAAAFVAGCLLWFVPLVLASGGVGRYLGALTDVASEDFTTGNMLWVERTPRRLAFALYETFVLPWAWIPLAVAVAFMALAGVVVAMIRDRRAVSLMAVAFAPYAIFHIVGHDTFELRYALPILPAIAWLAVQGTTTSRRLTPWAAGALVAVALAVAVPPSIVYGREPHPAFRLIADASERARRDAPAAVFSHFENWRPLQADTGGLPVVAPRKQYEWLGAVEYWRGGGTAPVWFFADPRRTDLDLIDPQARRDVTPYRWGLEGRPELAGMRPTAVDWYRLSAPGWFAGEGWGLTPETGGLAQATHAGPGHRPIEAWVRRTSEPMHLVIGGRHLGNPGEPSATFELAIDGVVRDRWTLTREEQNFLRFIDLPEGAAGPGAFAHLTVSAKSDAPGVAADVAVRQFNIQPAQQLIFGFGEGWHEEEFELATGQRWRWTSDRSILRVKGPAHAVRISLRGESPLRYFDAPPTVRVTAGGRVIAELQPRDDFEWTVTVPAEDVARAQGAIAIETDKVYLPGQAEGTTDERKLGLRLWNCEVVPVLP